MYSYNLTTSNLHYEKFQDGSVKQIEVPYEIPESWEWVSLNSISQKITDGSHNPPPNAGFGIQIISAKNIIDGKIDFSLSQRFITKKEFLKEDSRTEIRAGDILLSIVGSIGKVALAPENIDFTAQRSVSVIKTLFLDNSYLSLVFSSPYFQTTLINKSSGTAQKGIYLGELKQILIPLPPINEQFKIVDKFNVLLKKHLQYNSLYLSLMNLNSAFPEKLRKSILQYAMQGKLVPQYATDESVEVLLERIKEEKQRLFEEGKLKKKDLQESIIYQGDDNSYYENKFPKNWIITTLCNMGDISTGNTPSKNNYSYWSNGTIPFFKPADLVQKKNMHTASEYLSVEGFKKARYVEKDSILVNGIGNIGVTGMVKKEGAFNQQMHSVKPYNYIDSDFLFYLFNTNFVQEQMINNSSSTTIPILNKKKFSELIGVFPSLQEQKRIVSRIEKINFLIKKI